jgi:glucose/arabinose dehydrogenase
VSIQRLLGSTLSLTLLTAATALLVAAPTSTDNSDDARDTIVEPRAAQAVPPAPPKPPVRDVTKLYAEFCANCHGATMTGGQAPSMLDDVWTHGSDDASLARVIKEGLPDKGMPPWKGALSDQDVRAMVIYIREQGAKFRREGANIPKPAAETTVQSEKHAFKLQTVVEGVKTPWAIAFLPDGRILITEKAGQLRIAENGNLLAEPVGGIPAVWSRGQGGLLDVALHPDYAKNGWIYLSYSDPGPNDSAMTAIVRGRLRDGQLVDQETIYKAPTDLYVSGTQVHFGSRFVFDGRGHVFFSIGERGRGPDAQDLSKPNGKVHRIHDDGRVPTDNPFVKRAGALPTIWSYGNRNAQGLAQDPKTGDLWEVEHGPRGGDELNRIQPGRNYGWPVITYGMNYNGTPMTDKTAQPGMEQPVTYWVPSIAVCAIDFYGGSLFPQWKGNLFLSTLAQQELRRLVIQDRNLTHQEVLFTGVGRVRDVVSGPDGNIYVAFNEPDRIARLVPAPGGTTSSGASNPK